MKMPPSLMFVLSGVLVGQFTGLHQPTDKPQVAEVKICLIHLQPKARD